MDQWRIYPRYLALKKNVKASCKGFFFELEKESFQLVYVKNIQTTSTNPQS